MSLTEPPERGGTAVRDDPPLTLLCSLALSRLRHGLPLWTALATPLAVAALLVVAVFIGAGEQRPQVWDHWFGLSLYLWAILTPMLAGLYAIGVFQADEGTKRVMCCYAFPRRRLLFADILALMILWAGSALLFGALLYLAALANGTPEVVVRAFAGALIPVLAALPTLALCVIAAETWGMAGATCVGVAGMLFGALAGDKPYWWVFPPAWPTRAVIPIAETRAVSDFHTADDPLTSLSTLPVIAIAALALTCAFLAAGAWYVDRRDL